MGLQKGMTNNKAGSKRKRKYFSNAIISVDVSGQEIYLGIKKMYI